MELQKFIAAAAATPLALSALLLQAPVGMAQGVNDSLALDEIVVTARKVEERLQDIPLSIRAFGAEQIDRQGIARLEDVARLVPGLTFDLGAFPNDTRPAIRGMQAERGRPSVAVLLDGQDVGGENLYIAGGSSSLNTRLLDLERIEIVKGPQSVLYGRAAFSGAVNYISKRPSLDAWNGRLEVEGAEGAAYGVRGAFSGPVVSDKLAVRVNLASFEKDGYYNNPVTGENLGAESTLGGAISLLYKPTETLSFLTRYQYTDDEFSQLAAAYIPANTAFPIPGGMFAPFPGGPASPCPANLTGATPAIVAACTRRTVVGQIDATESDIQLSADPFRGVFPGLEQEQETFTTEATWVSGVGDFSLLFGWFRNQAHLIIDGDYNNYLQPSPFAVSLSSNIDDVYANQHRNTELRWNHSVNDFSFVLGVQSFNETSSLLSASQFWLRNPASIFGGFPFLIRSAPTASGPFPSTYSRDTEYVGAFGSLQWAATDKLRLTVEGRYNEDDLSYFTSGWTRLQVAVTQLVPMCPASPGGASSCGITASNKESKFTPRMSADYKLRDGLLTYATFAKGYKPGGYNVNEVTDLSTQGYFAENVTTYELGMKSDWLNNRLLFNVAAFLNDYTDQQVGVQRVDPSGQTLSAIANAGKVEIKGLELEANFRATQQITVSGSYAWTDATYDEFIIGSLAAPATSLQRAEAGNIIGDFSGKEVQKTPEHALNLALEYRDRLAGGTQWFAEAAASYRSERFLDEANLSTLPAHSLVDLRAGLIGERWSLTAYVNNVLDDDKIKNAQRYVDVGRPEGGFAPGRSYIAYLPMPRVVGLRADYSWR